MVFASTPHYTRCYSLIFKTYSHIFSKHSYACVISTSIVSIDSECVDLNRASRRMYRRLWLGATQHIRTYIALTMYIYIYMKLSFLFCSAQYRTSSSLKLLLLCSCMVALRHHKPHILPNKVLCHQQQNEFACL